MKRKGKKAKSKFTPKKDTKTGISKDKSEVKDVEEEEEKESDSDVQQEGKNAESDEDDSEMPLLTGSVLMDKQKKTRSGGFQSMGLSFPVLKGILAKGYKVPTPIQRKTIPVILGGKDVVAMARTGSGKTGAFLIPMLEKLKARTAKAGARALIFSPTRELALQTLKFTKEIGKSTGLKPVTVLGGEKIEEQFAAIHSHPDIIIATPGRFLHLVIEMDLKLNCIEYVVFDEADRLFEMGFQEQLEEVLHRLPHHRQTLMFSATLPRMLVDFARAGLTDPELIRLDVETKLSENLKTVYLTCRSNDKSAILLHLLKNVIDLSKELTVVFLATRHHVEYMKDILSKASIPCSYIYSSLDQTARNIHVAQFRTHKVGVLLVTDIAARGIDIPLLDNVINYNFPSKPKLFVHRVGRVARAGRTGTAYSLVASDELPYLIDLHLFLGKPLSFPEDRSSEKSGLCGSVPQSIIDEEMDFLRNYHEVSVDLQNMTKVCENAYKQYVKSRPAPSSESVKRVKELPSLDGKIHPLFGVNTGIELERNKFLAGMRNYRPNTTIFEIGATAKSQASAIMREKRIHHSIVDTIRSMDSNDPKKITQEQQDVKNGSVGLTAASESEIQATFKSSSTKLGNKRPAKVSKPIKKDFKDAEHYLTYTSSEHYTEKGLSLECGFQRDATSAVLDLTADDAEGTRKQKNAWSWDRKKKRFTKEDDGEIRKKKMKTENGVWIPKSYKSDLYQKWKNRNKVDHQNDDNNNDRVNPVEAAKFKSIFTRNTGRPKNELKTKERILKERKRKAKKRAYEKRKYAERLKKKRKK